MKAGFSRYHPLVNFTYFSLVLCFSIILMHPVCLIISLLSAFIYAMQLKGMRSMLVWTLWVLPTMLFAALLNPAFNHEGITILTYLPSGNPLTLESIYYGIFAAIMIMGVICWFSCCYEVMTSDKFIYLFGRVIPALSLVLSMILRFVPKMKEQTARIAAAQKGIGRDASSGNLFHRAREGLTILSILTTWALENAIDTADSMKSRGYGLKGRSAYSIFVMDSRDRKTLFIIVALGLYMVIGLVLGGFYFRNFPSIKSVAITPYTISLFCSYFALCVLPLMIEILEVRAWKAIN